ncbi:hypothetical protein [Pontibacter sp. G13]|uniref:hypothetical protein n=1 Tax=Pontibacter sp. G13 TaxID=3074898 RepID=UPI0028893B34|nr:hypothetical protein [Pontibacter sp. G13]WNJ19493.1 hypothetical protein RJD25_03280 [Pontibacter sp. G13]
MNPFFEFPPAARRRFYGKLAGLMLLSYLPFVGLIWAIGVQGVPFLLMFMAISFTIVAPFFDVPNLVQAGTLRYHSKFLLSELKKSGDLALHAGSLFDYYFTFRAHPDIPNRTAFILKDQLEGLLALLEAYQNHPERRIFWTTHFVSDRNAQRLGFQRVPIDGVQSIILIFNYFNLMLAASIAKQKWVAPNLSETKSFETTVGELQEKSDRIRSALATLSRSTLVHTEDRT